MRPKRRVTRRTALKLGAAATALPLVHIRTAGAAGKLSLALWDHWVPTGDAAMKKLVDDWAEKNKVAVSSTSSPSVGSKINITMAAEAQAKTGHDVYAFDQWTVQQYADSLDPMDDVMQRLIAKYGKLGRAYEYLGVVDKHWMAVPVGWGSAPLPPCARISLLEEVRQYRRAGVVSRRTSRHRTPARTGPTTRSSKMAEACFKAGYPIGFGCGSGQHRRQPDLGRHVRRLRRRPGERQGRDHRRVRQRDGGDGVRQKLVKFMPPDAVQLGRCLEQPRADLRQGRLYLEPAIGLGGGQARCAGGRGGLLDLPQSARDRRAAWCRTGRISGASGRSRRTRARRRS